MFTMDVKQQFNKVLLLSPEDEDRMVSNVGPDQMTSLGTV